MARRKQKKPSFTVQLYDKPESALWFGGGGVGTTVRRLLTVHHGRKGEQNVKCLEVNLIKSSMMHGMFDDDNLLASTTQNSINRLWVISHGYLSIEAALVLILVLRRNQTKAPNPLFFRQPTPSSRPDMIEVAIYYSSYFYFLFCLS